ncbi:MAG: preprotein translocase subunit YajC [Planctomycetes bacterium]|nr:preprotein translocase subunit YajC [Planctomycetota bacterium]
MLLPHWLALASAQGDAAQTNPGAGSPPAPTPNDTTSTTSPSGQPQQAAPQGGDLMSTLVLFGGMFLLLWLFLLGPERRKRKQHEQRLAQLKEKDEVMTLGGIFGTVVMLRGDQITIRVDEKRGTTLRIARSSIATILPRENGAKEKDKESDAEAE